MWVYCSCSAVTPDVRRSGPLALDDAEVRERIRVASVAARRTEPTLIVVTKTWPADDVRRLASLGVTDVGENRDQEAAPKFDATADLALRWHLVGQLQRIVNGYQPSGNYKP
jgi:uncharacterized pyridoxal phosphate-containing UPF0001 family protein